jgi:outer membrane protein OmpA-like peptidoglycan-associated protein
MKKLVKRTLSGMALAAVVAQSPSLWATDSITLDRFSPSLPGDRFFGVEGGDPGGHALPRAMILGEYGYHPLSLYDQNDNKVGTFVTGQLVLHLAAGVTLWDRLLIAADMPLTLAMSGNDVGTYQAPSGAAAGDLRISLRGRLLGEAGSIASLSLGGHVYLPTGNKDKFTGNGSVHGMPVLVLAGENDILAYAVNAGVNVQKGENISNGISTLASTGSQMTFGAALGFLLADRKVQLGPEIYGTTLMTGSEKFKKATTSIEGIVGLRARLADFVIGAGAGPGFTRGVGTPAVRVLLSAAYAPAPLPPPPPPPPPAPKKKKPVDRDHDGIYDRDDACPDEPGVPSEDPTKNGCPIPPDRDGDGIYDKDDACPDVRGVASPNPSENGCPPDTDGDGIRDDVDACPNEKGVPDVDPQKNGCPKSVRVTDGEIVILEQVQFKTGSAVILPVSDDLLRQVAAAVTEHPEIKRIEVQGHTDNRGGKGYNKKLSQKRADAVKKWLTSYGQIDPSRLTSRGYGMDEPIADNATPDGRQKNRRVQFKITEKTSRSEVMQ